MAGVSILSKVEGQAESFFSELKVKCASRELQEPERDAANQISEASWLRVKRGLWAAEIWSPSLSQPARCTATSSSSGEGQGGCSQNNQIQLFRSYDSDCLPYPKGKKINTSELFSFKDLSIFVSGPPSPVLGQVTESHNGLGWK